MNYLRLINKENPLGKNYEAKNLVKVKIKTGGNKIIYLEKKTYKQVKKLLKEMNKHFDTEIVIDSGYRSYNYQLNLMRDLIKEKGTKAFKSLAYPGTSEHQSGLAVDIGFYKDDNYVPKFKVDDFLDEFEWLRKNAYKYGFIVRYEKDKESITGYIYEPWHIRYVGRLAQFLYENNLCLEEYYDFFE